MSFSFSILRTSSLGLTTNKRNRAGKWVEIINFEIFFQSDFETSVVYLLKAINFAKDKKRYFFIVYNASLLYWKIARPFLREGCKKILHPSLSQIVKALELIEDDDYDWRALLMMQV